MADPCAGAALPDYSVACRWCGDHKPGRQGALVDAANGYRYHAQCLADRRAWGRADHLPPLRLPPVAELPPRWRENVRLLLDSISDAHRPLRDPEVWL